jgi:hypothetical protein
MMGWSTLSTSSSWLKTFTTIILQIYWNPDPDMEPFHTCCTLPLALVVLLLVAGQCWNNKILSIPWNLHLAIRWNCVKCKPLLFRLSPFLSHLYLALCLFLSLMITREKKKESITKCWQLGSNFLAFTTLHKKSLTSQKNII